MIKDHLLKEYIKTLNIATLIHKMKKIIQTAKAMKWILVFLEMVIKVIEMPGISLYNINIIYKQNVHKLLIQ